MNTVIISFIAGILMFSAGCANFREYKKDNLRCTSLRKPFQGWKYGVINIGTLEDPYTDEFPFSLKTDDGRIFTSSQLMELKTAQSISDGHIIKSEYSTWPPNTIVYSDKNFTVHVISNQIMSISLRGDSPCLIGDIEGKHYYPLPLTEKQIMEIFGPPTSRKNGIML